MNAKPDKEQRIFRWFRFSFLMSLSIIMLVTTFNLYREMKQEDQVIRHSPLVCMRITGRERHWGTVRWPDKIYAEYQGNSYRFDCGRKYFRRSLGIDSIQVHYDAETNRAVLPKRNFPHFTFLIIMLAGLGLITLTEAIRTFFK